MAKSVLDCIKEKDVVGFNKTPDTERAKLSRNGSTMEPFPCPQNGHLLGTVFMSLCKEEPFLKHEY